MHFTNTDRDIDFFISPVQRIVLIFVQSLTCQIVLLFVQFFNLLFRIFSFFPFCINFTHFGSVYWLDLTTAASILFTHSSGSDRIVKIFMVFLTCPLTRYHHEELPKKRKALPASQLFHSFSIFYSQFAFIIRP